MAFRARGVIDSLSAGFGLLFRRPYLTLVPILMDLLLLASPGISFKPLLERALDRFLDLGVRASASPEEVVELNSRVDQLIELAGGVNLLGLLAWRVPSLRGVFGPPAAGAALIDSWGPFLLALALLIAGGLLVGCLFMGPLGLLVSRGRLDLAVLWGKLGRFWVRLTLYHALLLAIALLLGLFVLLLAGFLPDLALVVALGLFLILPSISSSPRRPSSSGMRPSSRQ